MAIGRTGRIPGGEFHSIMSYNEKICRFNEKRSRYNEIFMWVAVLRHRIFLNVIVVKIKISLMLREVRKRQRQRH